MKYKISNDNLIEDVDYRRFFVKERKNDFLIIMKLIIASSFFFAIAVLII